MKLFLGKMFELYDVLAELKIFRQGGDLLELLFYSFVFALHMYYNPKHLHT